MSETEVRQLALARTGTLAHKPTTSPLGDDRSVLAGLADPVEDDQLAPVCASLTRRRWLGAGYRINAVPFGVDRIPREVRRRLAGFPTVDSTDVGLAFVRSFESMETGQIYRL